MSELRAVGLHGLAIGLPIQALLEGAGEPEEHLRPRPGAGFWGGGWSGFWESSPAGFCIGLRGADWEADLLFRSARRQKMWILHMRRKRGPLFMARVLYRYIFPPQFTAYGTSTRCTSWERACSLRQTRCLSLEPWPRPCPAGGKSSTQRVTTQPGHCFSRPSICPARPETPSSTFFWCSEILRRQEPRDRCGSSSSTNPVFRQRRGQEPMQLLEQACDSRTFSWTPRHLAAKSHWQIRQKDYPTPSRANFCRTSPARPGHVALQYLEVWL